MDTLSFIARYEAILKERKMPKMTLYKECGITDAAVSQWRKGKTVPSMKSIERIASCLGVTTEYLLGAEKETAPTPEDERDVTFDDFTYAMYEEGKELTQENKDKLLEMARFFKQQQQKNKNP